MTLVVRRSALKMWLMAMGGIPLLVISLDVLTNRRITRWFQDLIFNPEDIQIYEPRDVIWAWAMFLFAAFIVGWGLKELFVPTKVVECREEGLALKIDGPFRPASVVPWDWVVDVAGFTVEDEGEKVPLLLVEVLSREGLPANPWGARWVEKRVLGVLAQDWAEDPDDVAAQITDFAADAVRREGRDAVVRLWVEEEEKEE